MKKLVIILTALILVGTVIQTQAQIANNSKKEVKKEAKKEKKVERKALRKLEGTVTSKFVKKAFYADFGNIPNVVFARKDFMDEALFTKDGHEMTAYYDYHGVMVGTTSVVPFDKIPLAGQREIKKKYPDYKVISVVFYDDNEANDADMILYGIQFDDTDNYFVELSGKDKKLVLQVNPSGEIFFFKQLR